MYTLAGLEEGASYSVSLAAVNESGVVDLVIITSSTLSAGKHSHKTDEPMLPPFYLCVCVCLCVF